MATYNTWGGSWGGSWALSWTRGDTPPVIAPKGDDADGRKHRGVRPIVSVRPKVERDLDDALEIIETIASEKRPKENRDVAKTALAAIREVQIPISFADPVAKVTQALEKLSRRTFKKYGAMQQAAMKIAADLETVVAEMERRRKRDEKDIEALKWLL